jgi:prepilin-type processing-associated H-X9-DG protein
MGLALNAFHEANGAFPSAVMDDWGGSTQLHTWCVQLLPFVEESALYSRYDFAAGINAPSNQPVTSKFLPIYMCPSSDGKYYEGDGTFARGDYAAVSGTQPVDNGGAMFPKSKVTIKKITDGLSTTLLVGELYYHNLGWAHGSAAGTTGGGGGGGAAFSRGVSRWWSCNSPCAVPGLNPEKTECNNFCEQRFQLSSAHPGGVTFVYCDGHVDFIDESIHPNALRALTTIAGGELTN